MPFHVATFYSEGEPFDKGLALTKQHEHLKNAFQGHCSQFHSYSARRVRRLRLRDGTAGANYVKEYSAVAGYLKYPNTGYNTIGFGAFKPFIILHVLESLEMWRREYDGDPEKRRRGTDANLLFMDCNVLKHWNLVAYAPLAAQTTSWLLKYYGAEGVAMPRENPSTRHEHICSHNSLSGMEAHWRAGECRGAATSDATTATRLVSAEDLGKTPSPHSNRIAVRIADPAAVTLLHLWLAASHNETEYLPSPVRAGGRWHTPEQCSFGLLDACRHGRSELWFEYFFTPRHARLFKPGSRPQGSVAASPIAVARTRTPPHHIAANHVWGISLNAVADTLMRSAWREDAKTEEENAGSVLPPGWRTSGNVVDACLAFPRLYMRCPGVHYKSNGTHWNFERLSRPFVARML